MENMKKYEKKCGKYEELSGKYVKEYPLLYRISDLEEFRDFSLYVGFGTWKNSLYRLWDLEKF